MGKHSKREQQADVAVEQAIEATVEQTAIEAATEEPKDEIAELKAKLAATVAEAEQAERTAWEQRTKARNPQLVLGSLRTATDADKASLSHCHGEVAEISCVTCSAVRVVNKQDAFQVRYCETHKTEGRKAARKEKREIVGNDPVKLKERLLREIAKAEAKKAKLAPAATPTETTEAVAS